MAKIPEKISPLHDLAMPVAGNGGESVDLSERLCGSLVQVQAWPASIDKVAKLVQAQKGDLTTMQTGPGRWLIEDDEEDREEKLRSKVGSKLGAVTGLTHGRVVITIEGEKAAWVLASGIAIDFDTSVFPVGEIRLTHHHEIGLTIHRTAENAFDLYVFTSLARGFWHWIEKASAEVGYTVS